MCIRDQFMCHFHAFLLSYDIRYLLERCVSLLILLHVSAVLYNVLYSHNNVEIVKYLQVDSTLSADVNGYIDYQMLSAIEGSVRVSGHIRINLSDTKTRDVASLVRFAFARMSAAATSLAISDIDVAQGRITSTATNATKVAVITYF